MNNNRSRMGSIGRLERGGRDRVGKDLGEGTVGP